MAFQATIIFSLAALAQGTGSVSSTNFGIRITITSSVNVTNGRACIPQCTRANVPGYNNDGGAPDACGAIDFTATIENISFPGTVAQFQQIQYNWMVNGSGSGSGNGGIEAVPVAGKLPSDVADELQNYVNQSRNEWTNRNI